MSTTPLPKSWQVHAMLAGVALLYGTNYNVMKLVTPHYVPPYTVILFRVTGAAFLFGVVHFFFIKEKIQNRADFYRLLEGAAFGVAGSQLCYAKGLSLTTAVNASVIMTLIPVFVLIASIFLLNERIKFTKWLGIFLGGIGAFLLIGGTKFNLTSEGALGDFFILGNAAFFGIYLVRIKPLMARYHPLTVTKWIFLLGWFLVLPFGIQDAIALDYNFPQKIRWALAFIVIGVTFLVYLLSVSALKRASPGLVSFYVYFQPLVATSISLAIQTDELTITRVVAALLIFFGVYWVSRN